MVNSSSTEGTIPPYVSYRTFSNFITDFKSAIPSRIDRSVMTNVAGSVQAQLRTALRYLGLVDENWRTQETFRRLASAEGSERQDMLRSILEYGYPFLLHSNTFDLMTATPAEFSEQFKNQGAKGDTVRKCELFFLNAAKDAGIQFSERLEPKAAGEQKSSSRSRSSTSRRTPRSTNNANTGQLQEKSVQENSQAKIEHPAHGRKHIDDLLVDYAELRSFIAKLPRSKQWTRAKRDRWIKALTSMLDWEIEIIDEQVEGVDLTDYET